MAGDEAAMDAVVQQAKEDIEGAMVSGGEGSVVHYMAVRTARQVCGAC